MKQTQPCPGCGDLVEFGDEFCRTCEWPLDDLVWPEAATGKPTAVVKSDSESPRASRSTPAPPDAGMGQAPIGSQPTAASPPADAPPHCLLQLEVSSGRNLTVGSQQLLQCRVTNPDHVAMSYRLTVTSPELGIRCGFLHKMSPGESSTHDHPYKVEHAGRFRVSFLLEVPGRGVQYGISTINVASSDSQPVIHVQQKSDARMNAGAMNTSINVNYGEAESDEFRQVDLRWRRSLKFTRSDPASDSSDAVTLSLVGPGQTRYASLFGRDTISFGKSRAGDVTLRHLPETEENERIWGQISRLHAECRKTSDGFQWQNLKCLNGTQIDGQATAAGESRLLRDGMQVSPAGAVSLTCSLFELPVTFDERHYQEFATSGPSSSFAPPPGSAAARFSRSDDIASRETYVHCPSACQIGSGADCAVSVDLPEVAERHALVLYLDGSFWLEALEPVFVRGTALEPHELHRLTPGSDEFLLGSLRIRVFPLRQLGIDIPVR